ncbi:MAG: hypothetical protein CL503_01135 [Actinobacteria bacterium]|nr:hypothetical protein [Actinomycetota bacterium]
MQSPPLNPNFRQHSPKLVQINKSRKDPDNSSRSQVPKPRRPHSIISPSLEKEHTRSLEQPTRPRKP